MNDDDDDPRPPRHWGDYGALLLAGGFSLFGFYLAVTMALGGHPLAVLFRKQAGPVTAAPAPVSDEEARRLPFHAEKGEVVIMTNHPPPVFAGGNSFPQIRDWSSLRITLVRSICFGPCPIYTVQISGDGSVVFQGQDCVARKGEHRAKIATSAVAALVQRFKDVDYFSLKDQYIAPVTDNPPYRTSISFDGRSKTVVDYVGGMVGMPKSVGEIEDAIDKAAGTDQWIHGGTRTCSGRAVAD